MKRSVSLSRIGASGKLLEVKCHFHYVKHSIATHLLDVAADLHFVEDWLW